MFIDDSVDVEVLRDIGGVTEDLVVAETSTLMDLEFLSCLQEVGRDVWIYDNSSLVDLHGLERLRVIGGPSVGDVGAGIQILRNEALEDISGLESLESLRKINIGANTSLVNIGLPSLRNVEVEFNLGWCHEEWMGHPANNPSLLAIGDYPNIEHIGRFSMEGHEQITSLPSLVMMAENGVVFESAEFRRNVNLPATEIEVFATAAGIVVESCENMDDGKVCASCPTD